MTVAVCIETPTEFRRYTVAEATAIPLGTILKLTSANTAIASSGDTDAFAGIAWEEFKGGEGLTELSVAVNGIWDIKATAAAIVAGNIVNVGGADLMVLADAAAIFAGSSIGKALEDANDNVGRVAVGRFI